ncbi:hypothetical protein Bca4012_004556 [Brassica carinata]
MVRFTLNKADRRIAFRFAGRGGKLDSHEKKSIGGTNVSKFEVSLKSRCGGTELLDIQSEQSHFRTKKTTKWRKILSRRNTYANMVAGKMLSKKEERRRFALISVSLPSLSPLRSSLPSLGLSPANTIEEQEDEEILTELSSQGEETRGETRRPSLVRCGFSSKKKL